MREKIVLRFRFLSVIRKRESQCFKPRLEIASRFAPRKIVHVGGQTMGGKNRQAFAARIDERHHSKIVRSFSVRSGGMKTASGEPALFAIVQCGFVTMMAVGDDELVILHRTLDHGGAIG